MSDELTIVRTIDADSAEVAGLLPRDTAVRVLALHIGRQRQSSSSVAPISTVGGQVSGGGTVVSRWSTHHLGISFHNTGPTRMRVQMKLVRTDGDGFATHHDYTWVDMEPGERRRLWALRYGWGAERGKDKQLAAIRLAEVSIIEAPPDPRDLGKTISISRPDRSVYDLFGLRRSALPGQWTFGKVAVAVMGVAVLVSGCASIVSRAGRNEAPVRAAAQPAGNPYQPGSNGHLIWEQAERMRKQRQAQRQVQRQPQQPAR